MVVQRAESSCYSLRAEFQLQGGMLGDIRGGVRSDSSPHTHWTLYTCLGGAGGWGGGWFLFSSLIPLN